MPTTGSTAHTGAGHARSTTTIRLPLELRTRLDALAAQAGQSTHAFMLETLANSAERLEKAQAFEAESERRWQQMQRTHTFVAWDDFRDYVLALAAGEHPERPKPRKLPKAAAPQQRPESR